MSIIRRRIGKRLRLRAIPANENPAQSQIHSQPLTVCSGSRDCGLGFQMVGMDLRREQVGIRSANLFVTFGDD